MARVFKLSEVEFCIDVEPETSSFEDSFGADPEVCESIRESLDRGNEWAWCTVGVVAKWGGFTGTAYLGECSYLNEGDFIENSGYFKGMKKAAVADLKEQIKAAGWTIVDEGIADILAK